MPDKPEDNKDRSPCFLTHLEPLIRVKENKRAHFECRITPADDSTIKVDWYKDGEIIPSGNFQTIFEY